MTGVSQMGSAFLRRIRLTSDGREVLAELEDDFHHFEVRLGHDGAEVTAISGAAVRYPWSTCAEASSALARMVGMALSRRSTAHAAVVSPRANCTHLFDLAGLAVAHAAAGRQRRQYDARVPDRVDGRTRATLHRDGALVLEWDVAGRAILGPPPFDGQRLRGSGFITWAEGELDEDQAEAALVLRRALDIGMGRGMDLDPVPNAQAIAEMVGPVCFSFQPERAPVALRMKGTTWDFAQHPERLLGG